MVRARRWRRQVDAALAAPAAPFAPRAALHIPSRGRFDELEPNLRALLRQEYPALETLITVDSRSDPLFAACSALADEVAPGRARVVAVDDGPTTAQASGKCAAQLRGVAEFSPAVEVFVFADDDIRPGPDFVSRLVAPLADASVAVATGYRWYLSPGGGLPSHIRAAWNLVGLQIMFDTKWNFAWGGGMALRRADFDAWGIAKGWERAVSDDYVVTVAAKKDGRAIRFVPRALAPAFETVDFRRMIEWCRRQTFMTRIYDPGLWKFAVAPYLFFNSTMLLGAALLLAALFGAAPPWWALAAAAAFALHFPLNLVKAAEFYGGVRRMMPLRDDELRSLRGPYLAGAAFAPFVMIHALFSTRNLRTIEWRGRRYEVNGPLDVRPL